jgi:hypothetical protein
VIEARDLNDAIRVASFMPPARLGCIEVRPLIALGPDAFDVIDVTGVVTSPRAQEIRT